MKILKTKSLVNSDQLSILDLDRIFILLCIQKIEKLNFVKLVLVIKACK